MKKLLPCILAIALIIFVATYTPLPSISNHYFYVDPLTKSYERILNASTFVYYPAGFAGTMSQEAIAFDILFRDDTATKRFLQLEKEATIEGRLYALCAIYYLDSDYYTSLIEKYQNSTDTFNSMSGCFPHTVVVKDIIYRDHSNKLLVRNPFNNSETTFIDQEYDFKSGSLPEKFIDNLSTYSASWRTFE